MWEEAIGGGSVHYQSYSRLALLLIEQYYVIAIAIVGPAVSTSIVSSVCAGGKNCRIEKKPFRVWIFWRDLSPLLYKFRA